MWVGLLLASRPAKAAAAARWFSPLAGLTAPVAQALPEQRPLFPSRRMVVLMLAQVVRWPQPLILDMGRAHRDLDSRRLVEIPAQRVAGPADLRSRL